MPRLQRPPFPISVAPSDREGAVKGALRLRGLRTLDGSLPIWNIGEQGKGAGVSGGLPPGGV
jgi:hypothetical protein